MVRKSTNVRFGGPDESEGNPRSGLVRSGPAASRVGSLAGSPRGVGAAGAWPRRGIGAASAWDRRGIGARIQANRRRSNGFSHHVNRTGRQRAPSCPTGSPPLPPDRIRARRGRSGFIGSRSGDVTATKRTVAGQLRAPPGGARPQFVHIMWKLGRPKGHWAAHRWAGRRPDGRAAAPLGGAATRRPDQRADDRLSAR
jgi:hypothetical protein